MYSFEDVFVGEINEYCSTEYLMKKGVPFNQIKKAVENGSLIKLGRGTYALPDTLEDDYFLLQNRYSRGIFSDYSALFLHQMCDYIPGMYYMTFPRGYNCHSLADEGNRLSFKRADPKLYEIGVTEVATPCGNLVRTYDKERTLCDIVRGKGIDPDMTKKAMRSYLGSDSVDLPKLMRYADALHVGPKIHRYVDVMI